MSIAPTRAFSLEVDTAAHTPTATASNAFATAVLTTSTSISTALSNACSTNNDCADDGVCSNGVCSSINQAAPFAPAGSLGTESTTRLDTGTATGIGVGIAALVVLMIGAGFWWFKLRRDRQQPITSPEAPPTTRDRSESTATKWTMDNDQRTLVASMPSSPQHAAFARQTPELPTEFYTTPGKVIDAEGKGNKEIAAYRQPGSGHQHDHLPTSPAEKALPPPPSEEKRYAINVNINKSMIFDDIMFNAAAYAQSPISKPQERAPRYRFEEYVPPVLAGNPRISITKTASRASTMSFEYELENYPHGSGYMRSSRNSRPDAGIMYSEPRGHDPRGNALSKLEGSLSLPELPPPSPSFSFRSYDWYQDIIGGDQFTIEGSNELPALELPTTPKLPIRSPARGVNPLLSNPPDSDFRLVPEPLLPALPSPVASSHLHPSSARLSYLPSPTNPNFRLSPTVYQMPNSNRVSKLVPSLPSTRPASEATLTTMTQKSRFSRSWLPDEGLYLPEEGTEDSFEVFKSERLASRPTSYSPLA
ncbi:uncharacterized protein M421DRAFT_102590 [Didymella exigua CBS 183.55]|uniref:Uncharacterized protein n=1 Tax=Didymella exigua CBS 183.55 TaxID=1150837 RepID=A0A6A5RDB3_9PLEO|nr:uncharacterized protein M421DRAFT_102590 [Didymella exigua CBS 183.55]KAF1926241.1 hypothetical protein M421DRAFT_102590 [Didymella exigua CBS 183.55]